jgi:hypothetical protein
MSTACITLKMMELFSYAVIQKIFQITLSLSAWKKSTTKIFAHDQIMVKGLSNSEYIITSRKITETRVEQLN